jgi:hypothetical protein
MASKYLLIATALIIIIGISLLVFEGAARMWDDSDPRGSSQVSSPRQSEAVWKLFSRDR